MTHLAIAKEINDTIKIATDLPQYFMGAIAPDSVHFRENYHGEMKKQSHYNFGPKTWGSITSVEECEEWLDCLLRELSTPRNRPYSDYYWGYIIHILSDICNTRENFIYYRDWCIRENMPEDAYFNEQKHLDSMIFNTATWRDEVWMHLSQARGEAVGDIIKVNEVEKYRDYVFTAYNCETIVPYPKVYMTPDDNTKFIKNSAREIINVINTCS